MPDWVVTVEEVNDVASSPAVRRKWRQNVSTAANQLTPANAATAAAAGSFDLIHGE